MDEEAKRETSRSLAHVALPVFLAAASHSGSSPHSKSRSSSDCSSADNSSSSVEDVSCSTSGSSSLPTDSHQGRRTEAAAAAIASSSEGQQQQQVDGRGTSTDEGEKNTAAEESGDQRIGRAQQAESPTTAAVPAEREQLATAAAEARGENAPAAAAAEGTNKCAPVLETVDTAAAATPSSTGIEDTVTVPGDAATVARDRAAVAGDAATGGDRESAVAAGDATAAGGGSVDTAAGEGRAAGEDYRTAEVGKMMTYGASETDPSRVASAAALVAGTAEQQQQDAFGSSSSRAAASRKRKADAYLPDGDAETMDRLKKKLESLTKEQMKILLAKACVQYPAVEMALNSIIEADPASRRLMVRNVAFTTTEQALREKLESFGEIEDFKLVVERTSGQNKGFAFVTYRSMDSVQHILNDQVIVDGRHLQVKLASQQDPINAFKRVVPSCRLFVRNVPDTCDDERLRDEFSVFGEIREAVIIRSKEGKSKGYGFVVFEEPEALMKATCQSQRVIDGQVTFVSVASETPRRNGQQHQQQAQMRGSPGAAVPGAAGWALGTTPLAATANPYVQQMAALSPSLYMQQYQQHFMTASQVNAAVAAVTAQQQQPGVGAAAAQALQQHAQHGGLR